MMDGRGGCCIARYADGAYDMSKVGRIMLRFRPIAPKPAAPGAVSNGGPAPENGDAYGKGGRGKRRYVRDGSKTKKICSGRKRKGSPEEKTSSGGSVSGADGVVTLPLLPETPDRKGSPPRGSSGDQSDHTVMAKPVRNNPIWLSFDNSRPMSDDHVTYGVGHVPVTMLQPVKRVESCVRVECVTDMWGEGSVLGRTDEEKVMNLDKDTCPGFISDGFNRFKWANGAYRDMIGHGGRVEVVVWLAVKEGVRLPATSPAFACRVRVTCGAGRSTMTVPCDAWRMDGGGFAWRLDVEAALSLGR